MRLVPIMRGFTAAAVALSLLALTVPTAEAQRQAGAAALTPELAASKAALDKYKNWVAAVFDGYFSTVGCIDFPTGGSEGTMQYKPGGMGIHFLNPALIGPNLDPAKPQILIYEPVGDSLRLVAAEWFVPVPAAGEERPSIFGRALDGPMEGHEPIMPAGLHHYDLHVWFWKDNPEGLFSPTNPRVKCPKSAFTFHEGAPKMVPHKH